jgi:hypothetical protein
LINAVSETGLRDTSEAVVATRCCVAATVSVTGMDVCATRAGWRGAFGVAACASISAGASARKAAPAATITADTGLRTMRPTLGFMAKTLLGNR